jgi:hypothetical protein
MEGWLDTESTMKSPESIKPETPLSELVNGAGQRPLTIDQIVEKWAGVFEPEFWEEVRRARPPVGDRNA